MEAPPGPVGFSLVGVEGPLFLGCGDAIPARDGDESNEERDDRTSESSALVFAICTDRNSSDID